MISWVIWMPSNLWWIYSVPLRWIVQILLIYRQGNISMSKIIFQIWILQKSLGFGVLHLFVAVFILWNIFQNWQKSLLLRHKVRCSLSQSAVFCSFLPKFSEKFWMKHVENKAVLSRSLNSGPSFISTVSVFFFFWRIWSRSPKKVGLLGYSQTATCLGYLETSAENICPWAYVSQFPWEAVRWCVGTRWKSVLRVSEV